MKKIFNIIQNDKEEERTKQASKELKKLCLRIYIFFFFGFGSLFIIYA